MTNAVPVTAESLVGSVSPIARATIEHLLSAYGLESLTDWATGLLTEGFTEAEFGIELEQREEFQERFHAIFERRRRGLPPVSTDEILAFERQVAELESFYGFPSGTLGDPQDRMIADVSYNELQAAAAAEVAFQASDPATQAAAQRFYGIGATQGEVLSLAINNDVGISALQQRIQAANVAGQANVQGFGALTREEAEGLAAEGVDADAAREAFSMLSRSTQLTNNFDRKQLLSLAAGRAPEVDRLERARRLAQSPFEGGGSFAGGTAGIGVAR